MGFKKKNKEKTDASDTTQDIPREAKKVSDKSIKPRAPKMLGFKKAVRILIWTIALFIMIKGIVSFTQGTRVIENVTYIGAEQPATSDIVKGFAVDFSTEYFTWNINHLNDRIERLAKFISGIDQDAGLKPYEVKGSSRVLSVDVYDTERINDERYDITVIVRRMIEVEPDPIKQAKEAADDKAIEETTPIEQKTYMVVPITVTAKGLVVQSYPRFVSEKQKGERAHNAQGRTVTDPDLLTRSLELSDSFLQSYFEGNVSQLKYFYADSVKPPTSITKSSFTIEKIDQVNVFESDSSDLRIEASVIVKNELNELFTNTWILNAVDVDGRLYVKSVGQPIEESSKNTNAPATSNNNVPNQETNQNNNSQINNNPLTESPASNESSEVIGDLPKEKTEELPQGTDSIE
ncbi:hypothetical protein M2277_005618 [Paenibacillus sp. LBL]|uniref:conjugal transfer protein n=1 Tax=Paenibacillus sp. LBL TaxID=2940563 RepID=UPI002473D9CF|nr:conjugal transfer protein [Paenibacillus sp. LBL]MDH6674919.1 hypothetical protein [Paenibacillus sp. LBL]